MSKDVGETLSGTDITYMMAYFVSGIDEGSSRLALTTIFFSLNGYLPLNMTLYKAC